MPTTFTSLSVPCDLGHLIRKIAETEHKSIVDLISCWTKDAVAELGWDQDFSPIRGSVEWDGSEFIIQTTFFGECHRDFTSMQARSLARSIQHLADRGGARRSLDDTRVDREAAGRFGSIIITRKGIGITLQINDYECSMSIAVAQEVGRELNRLAQMAESRPSASVSVDPILQ